MDRKQQLLNFLTELAFKELLVWKSNNHVHNA
jgi:hypothetical protein